MEDTGYFDCLYYGSRYYGLKPHIERRIIDPLSTVSICTRTHTRNSLSDANIMILLVKRQLEHGLTRGPDVLPANTTR